MNRREIIKLVLAGLVLPFIPIPLPPRIADEVIKSREIHVSESGDDLRGDGSRANPYRSIQRGIDASEAIKEYTNVYVSPGQYYTT